MTVKDDKKGMDKLLKNLKRLEGVNKVPLTELLDNTFLRKYTQFKDFSEFEKEYNKTHGEKELDELITKTSKFKSWNEMIDKAAEEWTFRRLGI
jgi:hypothetical protein